MHTAVSPAPGGNMLQDSRGCQETDSTYPTKSVSPVSCILQPDTLRHGQCQNGRVEPAGLDRCLVPGNPSVWVQAQRSM